MSYPEPFDNQALAFPSHAADARCGMSIRVYLAAKAMQAILSSPGHIQGIRAAATAEKLTEVQVLAEEAFYIADAMLAEGRKTNEPAPAP